MSNPMLAALKYAVDRQTIEGLEFLRQWMHGEFDTCKLEWPDSPKECFEVNAESVAQESLKLNAKRYQFLRDVESLASSVIFEMYEYGVSGKELDKAIDTAMGINNQKN